MIKEFIKKEYPDAIRDITSLGSTSIVLFTLLILLVIQQYTIFTQFITGILSLYAIVIIIRCFYFKQRPKKEEYKGWLQKMDASSFPSMHTARAWLYVAIFSTATTPPITIALALIALAVSYSRIKLFKHFFIDVFAGALLGLIVGFVVLLL
jgi:membrane-associated phospholipid phosphatase